MSEVQQINHIFIVIVIYVSLNLYNINDISIFCGLARPKAFLFLFSHIFWWNHFSQTEQHTTNKPLSFSWSLSSKIQQHMQNMLCTIYIYLNVLQFSGMVQICFVLNIPPDDFASQPFSRLQFLVLHWKHNLLRMQFQILHNQRYWADAVQTYLLFEVWQKNNMHFYIWLYLFPCP